MIFLRASCLLACYDLKTLEWVKKKNLVLELIQEKLIEFLV